MRTIWKYPLEFSDQPQAIHMPKGAIVLPFFAIRDNKPTFWAEVDDEKYSDLGQYEYRYFCVHGTGHTIRKDEVYIKSCEMGIFIWHLFECPQTNVPNLTQKEKEKP